MQTRLPSRLVAPVLILLAIVSGVSPASAQGTPQPAGDVVRTASPAARGLGEADFPRVQRLAENVYSYEALRSAGEERFTTVSLFVVTPQGVLVADGQGNPAETQRMVEKIAEITPQPITHVVICSDHGDHTGGNSAFPRTATFLAHPTSKAVLERPSGRAGAAAPAHPPIQAVPDRHVLNLGGTEIHLLFLGRAHTGGDLSVYLPAQKVLFMSEAYLNRVFPAMRSAYPTEWVAAIERAQAMDVDVYVPGHGFVESPRVLEEELETYRRAMLQVIAEARRLHAAGRTADQAVAEARFGALEGWTLHSSQAAIAIRRVYAELNRELPPAP
jgi:glyoxylase-like metal-dependent hydrolase (beta-lactamase superfamily II)